MKKNNSKTIEGNLKQILIAIAIMIVVAIASSGMAQEDKMMEEDGVMKENLIMEGELRQCPITDSEMDAVEDYYLSRGLEPNYDKFPPEMLER